MIKKIFAKYNKLNKKIKIVMWIICLILFLMSYYRMDKYLLSTTNYNNGNKAFNNENYDIAESRYSTSLVYPLTKRRECKVRINYALSIVTPITPESVTWENLEESIERLIFARDILTQEGCAHEYDTNGHNKKAQTLKNEIDEYIEYLKENVKQPKNETKEEEKKTEENKEESNDPDGGNDDKQNKNNEDNNEGGNKDSEEKSSIENDEATEAARKLDELQKQIEESEKQGQYERFIESEFYDNWQDFDYYDGRSW